MNRFTAPWRTRCHGPSLSRVRWLHRARIARALAAAIAGGLAYESTLEIQVLPDISSRVHAPLWVVAIANVLALTGSAVGAVTACRMARRRKSRALAAASAVITAGLLAMLARTGGIAPLCGLALLLGLGNQSLVLINGRFRDRVGGTSLFGQGVLTLGSALGVCGGKALDAIFAADGHWTAGLASKSIAVAALAPLVYLLVPKRGAAEPPRAATDMRGSGRAVMASLLALDSALVLLISISGHGIGSLGILGPTFVVAALAVPLLTAMVRRLRQQLPRPARGSREGPLIGASTGIGYASLTLMFSFTSRLFGLSASVALLVVWLGFTGLAGALFVALWQRGRMPGRAVVVSGTALGAVGAAVLVFAWHPAVMAIGLVALGVRAAVPQLVQGAARRRSVAVGSGSESLNARIDFTRRLVESLVMLVVGLAVAFVPERLGLSDWRAPYALLAVALAVEAALWSRCRWLPPPERKAAAPQPRLREVIGRAHTRGRLLATVAVGAGTTAMTAPLAMLVAGRGGVDPASAAVVVSLLASARILGAPAAVLLAPWIARSRRTAGMVGFGVATAAGVGLLLGSAARGCLLIAVIAASIAVAEGGFGVGFVASKSQADAESDQGAVAMALALAQTLGRALCALLVSGLAAGFGALARVVPAEALGVGVRDLGPTLGIGSVTAFALVALRFGLRATMVRTAPLRGRGAVMVTVLPQENGRPPRVVLDPGQHGVMQGPRLVPLCRDARVEIGWWDGTVITIAALRRPITTPDAGRSGWLERPGRRYVLPGSDGHAYVTVEWNGGSELAYERTRLRVRRDYLRAACRSGDPELHPGTEVDRFRLVAGPPDDPWEAVPVLPDSAATPRKDRDCWCTSCPQSYERTEP